jgi:CheY-like chemotaxis protein
LIVDDSRFQHSVLRQILAPAGYELLFASNGKEALELLAGHDADLILADLIMPEMRGTTLLELLRDRGLDIPVVVLTADIQEHVAALCLELGARKVVHKPVKADALLRSIADVLGEEAA